MSALSSSTRRARTRRIDFRCFSHLGVEPQHAERRLHAEDLAAQQARVPDTRGGGERHRAREERERPVDEEVLRLDPELPKVVFEERQLLLEEVVEREHVRRPARALEL